MNLRCLLLVATVLVALQYSHGQIPKTISYQGFLENNGQPVNGTLPMTFRMFTQESGGAPVWTQSFPGVTVADGIYSVVLDVPTLTFDMNYWLEPEINGSLSSTRTKLTSAPYSLGPWNTDNAAPPNSNIHYNGNVGIGTTTPGYKLDVVGTLRAARDMSNDIVVQTTGGTNSWARLWTITPNQAWTLGTAQNFNGDQFYLYDATHNHLRMTVQPNGGEAAFLGPFSNHLVVRTTGGTNSWAQFRVQTTNRLWAIGSSQGFNDDQLYFSDLTAGQIRMAIAADGNVGIGTTNPTAKLEVIGRTKTQVLEITGGSDLAEPFDMESNIEPGTVMVIDADNPGMLRMSNAPYDSRVAGIVSGAGGVNPGITLHQEGVVEGTHPVAIAGRVYCKAEALSGPIKPGDLLTTSNVKGHAMKASGKDRSHGAIIGKAMSSLKEGTGLVLVLVNLH